MYLKPTRAPTAALGCCVDQGAFGGLIGGLPNGSFFTEFGENPLPLFVGVAVTLPWVRVCIFSRNFCWVAACACATGACSAAAAESATVADIAAIIRLFMSFNPFLSLVQKTSGIGISSASDALEHMPPSGPKLSLLHYRYVQFANENPH